MTPLRFDPSDLPEHETLIFVPQFRGVSGQVQFESKRSADSVAIGVHAKLGILLFRNAFDFEARSEWRRAGGGWELIDYKEINNKSGKTKSSTEGLRKAAEKKSGQQILDPAALLFALRQNPLREVGDKRAGSGVRGENLITLEFTAAAEKTQTVKAFGSAPRKLLKLELLIETPKSPSKIPVFQDGRSGFWLDADTNIPAEISYEIPPIGSLSVALEKMERS